MIDPQQKWNRRYRNKNGGDLQPQAALVLTQNLHLLPASGFALDLACGLGGNALLLAQQGLQVHAWDISEVAIGRLRQAAKERNVTVVTMVRDVVVNPPQPNGFDVIVVSHFLERSLVPALMDALKPGGVIFYQTFIKQKVQQVGPDNPAYLLDRNELLKLFAPLTLLVYREEGLAGDPGQGFRNEAMLVAQKAI